MFDRVVLPLDGSDLAEAVLPYGQELARKMGSRLTLFHACDASHKLSHNMHKLYLDKRAELMCQGLNLDGPACELNVSTEHRFGDFTPSLCDYINQNDVGLVIMVARGFTSLKVRLMGSIVDDVARLAKCPTLLVRRENEPAGNCDLMRRLLVPLDGTAYSLQALEVVRPMAEKLGAEVVLFSVARQGGYSRPASDLVGETGIDDGDLLKGEKKRLESYLEGIATSLKGLVVSIKVGEGNDAAAAIDVAARETGADVVVMVTSSPVTAWAPGSVAHKLLNMGETSLLVMHRK